MVQVLFIYMNNKYNVIYKNNEPFNNLLINYSLLINKKVKDLIFVYNGKILSLYDNKIQKQKSNITIFVFNLKNENNNE